MLRLIFKGEEKVLPYRPSNLDEFASAVVSSFEPKLQGGFTAKYKDPDGDIISITNQEDFKMMVDCSPQVSTIEIFESNEPSAIQTKAEPERKENLYPNLDSKEEKKPEVNQSFENLKALSEPDEQHPLEPPAQSLPPQKPQEPAQILVDVQKYIDAQGFQDLPANQIEAKVRQHIDRLMPRIVKDAALSVKDELEGGAQKPKQESEVDMKPQQLLHKEDAEEYKFDARKTLCKVGQGIKETGQNIKDTVSNAYTKVVKEIIPKIAKSLDDKPSIQCVVKGISPDVVNTETKEVTVDLEFINDGSDPWNKAVYLFCRVPGQELETIQVPMLPPGQSFLLPVSIFTPKQVGDHVLTWDVGISGRSLKKLFIHLNVVEPQPKLKKEDEEKIAKLTELFPAVEKDEITKIVVDNQTKTIEELSEFLLLRAQAKPAENN